jgi:hypothetical protein
MEQKIYPNHEDEWYVYHNDSSRYVSDCSVLLFLVIYLLFSVIFLLTFSCIVNVGCHGCDHMVVVLITTYAISAYHH